MGPKIATRNTNARMTAATAATRSLTSSRNHFEAVAFFVEGAPTIAVVGLTGMRSSPVLMSRAPIAV